MSLHKDVTQISYRHKYDIYSVMQNIIGSDAVKHFSLNLIRPDGEILFFSGTPSHAFEICNRGFGEYDGIISPEYYTKNEFYWWEDAAHKAHATDIQYIRKRLLNLHDGFMLVRKFDDFHIMYSYAFHKSITDLDKVVLQNLDKFLRMGDDAYMHLRAAYQEYCGKYQAPKINQFYPFSGELINHQTRASKEQGNIIQLFDR